MTHSSPTTPPSVLRPPPWRGGSLAACADIPDPLPGSCLFSATGFYTSKEPYAPRPEPERLPPPPEGFRVVMVQHVARHGSRALSSPDDNDLMLQLWSQARGEGALTPLGELLGAVLEDVIRVHAQVGYGLTSGLGRREHEETAARLVQRHPALFDSIPARGQRIDVFHSGRDRADESGDAFIQGLVAAADPSDRIEDEMDAAEALYGLYSIAVGMTEEARWDFGRFMHPEAAAWFAYTYETNPWRSERVSPMAANVQWDVFRNDQGNTLVRMLHQEGEVGFGPGCRPWGNTRTFYEVGEVERCLGF